MAHDKYIKHDFNSCLGHLIEECGEVISAAGKTVRFGKYMVNPELPPAEQETNIDWLKREIVDLKGTIERMEQAIKDSQ